MFGDFIVCAIVISFRLLHSYEPRNCALDTTVTVKQNNINRRYMIEMVYLLALINKKTNQFFIYKSLISTSSVKFATTSPTLPNIILLISALDTTLSENTNPNSSSISAVDTLLIILS